MIKSTQIERKLDQKVKFIFRWKIWKLNSTFEARIPLSKLGNELNLKEIKSQAASLSLNKFI